jgi:osmotically-inducible protein OsmY
VLQAFVAAHASALPAGAARSAVQTGERPQPRARGRAWRGSAKIPQYGDTIALGGIMSRFHSVLALGRVVALPLLIPLALGGCAGAVVAGLAAAGGAGYAANQERGVGGGADDLAIKTDVEKSLMLANPQLQSGVTTSVYEGRVLLTGRVANQQMRATAERAAGTNRGVRAVYDELEVAAAEGVWDDAQDAWITTRVRSEMVLDSDVRSVNYTIDTANGSVYLIGSARSQGELDRATRIARYVPGVKRVVSYVELRSGAPVAAGPPPGAGAPPNAVQRAPIEVQKL